MSTQGVNQSGSSQSTSHIQQQDYDQQSRKVSERQANDFADRMAKEKRGKEKKTAGDGGDKEQSLESLMAERNKNKKPKKAVNSKETINNSKETINNSKETINNPKETINNSKETINNPKETINNPKETINNPKETINNSKETINNSKETINNSKETINNSKYATKNHENTIKSSKDSGSSEDTSSANAKDASNFKNAVKGRDEKDQSDNEDMLHNMRAGTEHAMLNNTQNQIKPDIQIREVQQVSSVKEVDAALQKLADQIHVSAKDAVNGAEVRITLKDSVLPGTEIRIQRQGGELTVTMNTSSAEAGNFLAQHEANLQKMLSERFSNDKVQVNINMSGGDNQDTDGRSRNQYVAEDDDQNSSRNDRT